jgi:pimeloyl-ACP methyl ester carboxylesterase
VLTSATARGAGAEPYYERRGAGPTLLLVAGGGGDHGYYDGRAECFVFPGGHTAQMEVPGAFGPVLRDLLPRLRGSGGPQRDGRG